MLAAILNSLAEAVITVGRDHRIAGFNRAAERLVGISEGDALGMEDIADEVREHGRARPKETTAAPAAAGESVTTREEVSRRFPDDAPTGERDLLLRTLEEHRWNRGTAAAALGIDRSTLWRKMKRLGIA